MTLSKKIYINLAEDTDPEYYLKFGRRTLPVYNTFQTALDLFQDMRIGVESVLQVARDLILYIMAFLRMSWN